MNLILPRKNVKWRWWNALEGKDALKNQSIIVTGGERPLQTFQSVLCELAGGILYFDWGYLLWEVAQALAVLHVAHSACCVKYELMYRCLETEQSIKLVSTDKWVESHGRCGIFSYHPNFPWFHSSLNFWESPRLFPIPSLPKHAVFTLCIYQPRESKLLELTEIQSFLPTLLVIFLWLFCFWWWLFQIALAL